MNCEKCKNRKATVFFADEGGGRHALCASCGAIQGKLGQITTYDKKEESISPFLPSPSLLILSEPIIDYGCDSVTSDATAICPVCKNSVELLVQSKRLGCATCYTVFADLLALKTDTQDKNDLGRMPRAHRLRRDRKDAIAKFKLEIKQAVENENYELAATLRDKIKKLETTTV